MPETIRAKRTTIAIAGISIEVFQLPDGSYVMSQTQVAEAVGVPSVAVLRFPASKTAQAVLGKDFTFYTLNYSDSNEGRGNSGSVKAVPLNVATAFWVVQSTKGNEKARALVNACAIEALERRCDPAFKLTQDKILDATKTHSCSEAWQKVLEYFSDACFYVQASDKNTLPKPGNLRSILAFPFLSLAAAMAEAPRCYKNENFSCRDEAHYRQLMELRLFAQQVLRRFPTGSMPEELLRKICNADNEILDDK